MYIKDCDGVTRWFETEEDRDILELEEYHDPRETWSDDYTLYLMVRESGGYITFGSNGIIS